MKWICKICRASSGNVHHSFTTQASGARPWVGSSKKGEGENEHPQFPVILGWRLRLQGWIRVDSHIGLVGFTLGFASSVCAPFISSWSYIVIPTPRGKKKLCSEHTWLNLIQALHEADWRYHWSNAIHIYIYICIYIYIGVWCLQLLMAFNSFFSFFRWWPPPKIRTTDLPGAALRPGA